MCSHVCALSVSLQRTAILCNTLQCIATLCNTLQQTAAHCNTLQHHETEEEEGGTRCVHPNELSVPLAWAAAVCCSVLQCVAVCCSVLQCVAVCCSVLWCTRWFSRLSLTNHQFRSRINQIGQLNQFVCHNTLQQTATHCNALQHPTKVSTSLSEP